MPLEKKQFETEFLMYQKCGKDYFQLFHCHQRDFSVFMEAQYFCSNMGSSLLLIYA